MEIAMIVLIRNSSWPTNRRRLENDLYLCKFEGVSYDEAASNASRPKRRTRTALTERSDAAGYRNDAVCWPC